MKTIHIYKHIGYYNEVGDIRNLSQKSADEILDYYKHGYGSFYEDEYHEKESDIILEDETDSDDVRVTTDKKFLIVDGSWDGWKEEYKDSEEGDDSTCFIDIYELYKEEERPTTQVKFNLNILIDTTPEESMDSILERIREMMLEDGLSNYINEDNLEGWKFL